MFAAGCRWRVSMGFAARQEPRAPIMNGRRRIIGLL